MKLADRRKAKDNFDPSSVDSNSYNDEAGARKVIQVGPKLIPLNLTATTWTTDASTRRKVGKGKIIAVFNSGAVEISQFVAEADVADSLDGDYISISSPTVDYHVWFNTSGGAAVDPSPGTSTPIEVALTTGDSAIQVADAIRTELAANFSAVFTTDAAGSATLNITATVAGVALSAPTVGTTGWGTAAAVTTAGSTIGPSGVIRVGDITVVSGPAGSVDANGNVSIPCKPNDWTYINTYNQDFIVTNASTVLCFIVQDHTFLENRGT